MQPAFLSVLLVIVGGNVWGSAAAAETWGEVKKCANREFMQCHEKCAESLSPSEREKMKGCSNSVYNKAWKMQTDCLSSNGYPIKDSTPCSRQEEQSWSVRARAIGRHTKDFTSPSDLLPYIDCIKVCLTDEAKTAQARCTESCPEPPPSADSPLGRAMAACEESLSSGGAVEAASAAMEFISCSFGFGRK